MDTIKMILQVVIALSIFNVWLVRYNKATKWRGGSAKSLKEEFQLYGLSDAVMGTVGFVKLLLAALLIAGVWLPFLVKPAAAGVALLMAGAVAMHMRVRDPLIKSLPAFTLLVLALIVFLL